jgi:glycosyltransferase involved in cell wall biosynthesis
MLMVVARFGSDDCRLVRAAIRAGTSRNQIRVAIIRVALPCGASCRSAEECPMRVLIATDAWHPHVAGIVRTLTAVAASARELGVTVEFLTPDGFRSIALPTYPNLRLALPGSREVARRIEAATPDAIHIATEGPIGFAARAYCRSRRLPFTTSYTTRFPEYIAARAPIPLSASYAVLRRFHNSAAATMVATPSLMSELDARGFQNLRMWTRGVDTDLFAPERAVPLDLPRPIFLSAGRVAVEKNLAAFLALDLPGSKVVVGDGPQEAELRRRFPDATFLGLRKGTQLAGAIAAADVFVFPSRTDTFGIVQLEALACGVPVAAFPVTGPKDVIANLPVGVLDADLRAACLGALAISRAACRAFALTRSWTTSARQFVSNLHRLATAPSRRGYPVGPVPASAQG